MKKLKKIVFVFTSLALTLLMSNNIYSSNLGLKSNIALNKNIVGGAYLTIAGKFGGNITKEEIKDHYFLGVDGCAKGSKITNYTILIKIKGETITLKEDSNKLIGQIHTLLKGLKKGESFTFKNVKAKLPSGNSVDVVSKTFTIT